MRHSVQRNAFRISIALFATLFGCHVLPSRAVADPAAADARKIAKEPAYQQVKQQYLRLLIGQKPPREIWIVRDGMEMYIDRNANGDLTDAGEKVTIKKPELGPYSYVDLGMIDDAHGVAHGPLRILLTTDPKSHYRVDFPIAKKFAQVARFVPANTTPETASVLHFDGPLASGFLSNVNGRQGPSYKPESFTLSRTQSKQRYLASWVGTQVKDSPPVYSGHFPQPEEDAKKPRLKIVYEPRDPKQPPIVETHLLEEETPYLYSRRGIRAPMDSGAKAKITLTFPALAEVPVYEIEVKVVD